MDKSLPALTRPDGGDGVEFPNTLTKALPLTRDIDMIITGHGGVAKPQELEVHRDFMRDFLESTRQAKKAGKTAAAAAKAWKLPARYVGYEAQPARVVGGHGVDLPPAAIAVDAPTVAGNCRCFQLAVEAVRNLYTNSRTAS